MRAIGNVCPLRMNGVYALVIGSADERLQRLPEVYRMLSSYVQIEGSVRVVAFDQLEMVVMSSHETSRNSLTPGSRALSATNWRMRGFA